MFNSDNMADRSIRMTLIQQNTQLIDYNGRQWLCEKGVFNLFLDVRLYDLKYKRNDSLHSSRCIYLSWCHRSKPQWNKNLCFYCHKWHVFKKRANCIHSLSLEYDGKKCFSLLWTEIGDYENKTFRMNIYFCLNPIYTYKFHQFCWMSSNNTTSESFRYRPL